MMPYFFATRRTNYVGYRSCYLRAMHKLPGNILDAFMKGEHVMHHQDGFWNGIWSDMMIETTYLRSVVIGSKQLTEFEESLLDGCYATT